MGAELIYRYFPDLDQGQKARFEQLQELYEYWNERINVISRKDMDNLYERHVLHSLAIAKIHPLEANRSVLDVGTGGGFPGIPLAILYPQTEFLLVDSIGKKIKVVQEVATSLGLKNVKSEHIRAEKVKGPYDYVVTRAVMRMRPLIQTVKRATARHTVILALKGGDLTEELSEVSKKYSIHNVSDIFTGEFFQTKRLVKVRNS